MKKVYYVMIIIGYISFIFGLVQSDIIAMITGAFITIVNYLRIIIMRLIGEIKE